MVRDMSAPKHILLRIWLAKREGEASQPSKNTVIWELERWYSHRLELAEKYGDKVDEMFVIARGGRQRLKLLQQSLHRLDRA